ncbi:TPA: hypothetical protein DCQ44_02890 [Candidatus Taylorbacteria bacterium]|nr:hypothetical protein [Candidatus Taylorbacteria bacterium]
MKTIVASIVIAAAIIYGAVVITNRSSTSSNNQPAGGTIENVSVENGKQIITLAVRGGYSPRVTNAKANVPTILRLVTSGTFDCSSAVQIPALGYRSNLPQSGVTEVEVPPQSAGTSIKGMCIMGMYTFNLNFS